MCCFANEVLSVFATKIFARLSGRGTQYLAYEMQYESVEPNAMILPIPVQQPANDQSLQFIDLSDYEHFFGVLAGGYPDSDDTKKEAVGSLIPVHQVGNFSASFVPTMDDFDRLDPQYAIPKETWLKIPGYENYGFAVFQLKELKAKPHPMAFKFNTSSDKVFFPTVHIHDGQVHPIEKFDHVLYLQHAGLDSLAGDYVNSDVVDRKTDFIRSKDVAGEYCHIPKSKGLIAENLLIHRMDIKGEHKNEDLIFAIDGDPLQPVFRPWKLTGYWPLAFLGGFIAWFFYRRGRISALKSKDDSIES